MGWTVGSSSRREGGASFLQSPPCKNADCQRLHFFTEGYSPARSLHPFLVSAKPDHTFVDGPFSKLSSTPLLPVSSFLGLDLTQIWSSLRARLMKQLPSGTWLEKERCGLYLVLKASSWKWHMIPLSMMHRTQRSHRLYQLPIAI